MEEPPLRIWRVSRMVMPEKRALVLLVFCLCGPIHTQREREGKRREGKGKARELTS